MTIDPMNAPIFGDVARVDPPRPVRIATALVLAQVGVAAGYRLYLAFDGTFWLYLIPFALAVWFALSVRSGHNWARTASSVLSCLMIAMTALMVDYSLLGMIALAVSAVFLLTSIGMMWRTDVSDYFGV
ncbi:MAG TPA: hypothetical protein VGX25_12595 [Actinophytocola sp.]|uniref:hypothetical protein n=1 Tax=Actinophytocola sp. TaxID=1872138 RepID=UPI002DDD7562|nr:hypothetical protein [Actinophytocola sp.]HEV2780222.1 hypothetical protein [Actinophytocola sp.]